MDFLFAEDKRVILHQRSRQKLEEDQHKQEERKYRLWQLKREERREAAWFKFVFLSIGLLIGVPVGGLFAKSNPDLFQKIPLFSQPFGQSQAK
ncbi:MAG: hypothetical protein HC851_21790 [Acaryochloris sp. RU_4_1]|nr:hypothetical protein [Acaryochloris sp. RU_4_1]NJR56623.1 hypothetical protein [Acaryochloris sp. CRU_2_0]